LLIANTARAGTLYLPRQFDPSEMGTVGIAFMNSDGYWINVSSSVSTAKVIGTAVTTSPGADNVVANLVFASFSQGLFPQCRGPAWRNKLRHDTDVDELSVVLRRHFDVEAEFRFSVQ
jgi:hypothetical protein